MCVFLVFCYCCFLVVPFMFLERERLKGHGIGEVGMKYNGLREKKRSDETVLYEKFQLKYH